MSYMFRLIRSLFCDHTYGDGVPCPFIDEYGNNYAVYTCEKCGRKYLKCFNKER